MFDKQSMSAKQIIGVTILMCAFFFGAYGIAGYSLATRAPKSYVDKAVESAHTDAVGTQDLYSLCEADVVQAVIGAGGTLSGKIQHVAVVVDKVKNTAAVKVRIKSNIYTGGITCTYSKSNWQSQGIQPTG